MSKVFISYKYRDPLVTQIPELVVDDLGYTSPRSYVDMLDPALKQLGHICKAEKANEPLVGLSEDVITSKLADRIYDSTVSIVLISKGMNDQSEEKDQWIPWEVSYALTENNRGGRVSATNAMIAVILPDENRSYDYFITDHNCPWCSARFWHTDRAFEVIGGNMFNLEIPKVKDCNSPTCANTNIHTGHDHSYIRPLLWNEFTSDINGHIQMALDRQENIDLYKLKKRPWTEQST